VKIYSDSETAVWRHVDTAGKDLWQGSFEGCDTLGKLWDNAARYVQSSQQTNKSKSKVFRSYASMPCMGTRKVMKVHLEKQPSGRTFQKLELGEYIWKNFRDIDDDVKRVACALNALGQKKNEKVVIYAETRSEWMVAALACFKYGFPGMSRVRRKQ